MADRRVSESEVDGIDYGAYTEVVLVRPGESEGRTVYRAALVLSAGRGEPPRGLLPSQIDRLLVEVAGNPDEGDVARAVKRGFGLEGTPGNPFGWSV